MTQAFLSQSTTITSTAARGLAFFGLTLILAAPAFAKSPIEAQLEKLASTAIQVEQNKVTAKAEPIYCFSRTPFGELVDAQGVNQVKVREAVSQKCRIHQGCKANIRCQDQRSPAPVASPAPSPNAPTPIQVSGGSTLHPGVVVSAQPGASVAVLRTDEIYQAYRNWKAAHEELSVRFQDLQRDHQILREQYLLPKQTQDDQLIIECQKHAKISSDMQSCFAAAQSLGASTALVNTCAKLARTGSTTLMSEVVDCLQTVVHENVSYPRIEACGGGSLWSERKACLTLGK